MQKSPSENLERIAIVASAIGTIASALSSQAVYAAMPITCALFLNLVNRNDIKKQTQSNVNVSLIGIKNDVLSKIGAKTTEISNLTNEVAILDEKLKDVSINLGNHQEQTQNNFDSLNSQLEERPNLNERIANLDNQLNSVSINLGNHQQQTQNNFDLLNSQLEELPNLNERVTSLDDRVKKVFINLGNHQEQVQNNFDSLNSRIEKIPNLTNQVENLSNKFNDISINLINQVNNLTSELNNISINLGNFSQQTQNNFDSFSSKAEKIPDLARQIENLTNELKDISTNLGNSNQQTQNNFDSVNSRIEQIADVTRQIEELTDKCKNLTINQGNFQEQTQNDFNSLNSRIEELPNLTKQVKEILNILSNLENNIDSKFNETKQILNQIEPHRYELIYGRPKIRDKLRESLRKANQRLIMVCPWVSQCAVDSYIQYDIQETLHKNKEVEIHIGWGNLYDIKKSRIQSLQELLVNGRYDAINIFQRSERVQLKLLGTHEKFLICDDQWALITSYNFLSASDLNSEREVALLTYDKNIIAELINHYESSPHYTF